MVARHAYFGILAGTFGSIGPRFSGDGAARGVTDARVRWVRSWSIPAAVDRAGDDGAFCLKTEMQVVRLRRPGRVFAVRVARF
jgi:hypothetical protein